MLFFAYSVVFSVSSVTIFFVNLSLRAAKVLQRYFSTDSKTIGKYLIGEDRCLTAPIAKTAQKSNFYKVNDQGDCKKSKGEMIIGNGRKILAYPFKMGSCSV